MLNIVEKMKRFFPTVPVIITNDANAAAVGEMVYGGAKGMKDFLVVTLVPDWAAVSSQTAS